MPEEAMSVELIQGMVMPDEVIHHLPVEQLTPSRLNPRKAFDKDYIRSLANSIKLHGVIQAITVRPAPDGSGGADTARYEIVAGECRWRASKLATRPSVPAIVRELTDAQVCEIQLIENKSRKNLAPIEEAAAFQHLIDAGKTVAEVAALVGGDKKRSASYVYALLKLLELVPEAKKALEEKRITAGHGVLIARLQPPEQKTALGWFNDMPGLSVRDLSVNIEHAFHIDLADAPWAVSDGLLVEKAGACTVCPKKQQLGKKEVCTDPACWETKWQAHLKLSREEAIRGTLVMISTRYSETVKDIVSAMNWRPAQLVEEHTKVGIVVDRGFVHGADHKLGDLLDVCLDKKCETHWGGSQRSKANPTGNSDIAAHQAKQKAAKEQEAQNRAVRLEAAKAIIEKNKWPLPPEQLSMLGKYLVDRLDFDEQKAVMQLMGLESKDANPRMIALSDLERRAGKLQGKDLGRWIITFILAHELAHPEYSEHEYFHALAKAAGVNLKAIEQTNLLKTAAATYSGDTIDDHKGKSTIRGMFHMNGKQWVCVATTSSKADGSINCGIIEVVTAAEWKGKTWTFATAAGDKKMRGEGRFYEGIPVTCHGEKYVLGKARMELRANPNPSRDSNGAEKKKSEKPKAKRRKEVK